MPSASAMSASVCLISSLSSGGSGLGKPGGKRGSSSTALDNQDAQSDVSVITPPNANTSVDNRAQVTPGNNTNAEASPKQ
jgi:hypothetical protein